MMKFGYVAVVGSPNVGKSTLVNRLVGIKVAAISPRPQTTRNRLLGVKTTEQMQAAFVDTPGLHKPINELGEYMVSEAKKSLSNCDLVYHLIDSGKGITEEDERAKDILRELKLKVPIFCLFTKIDLIRKDKLLPMIAETSGWNVYSEIIPISAVKGDGLDELVKATEQYLPEGEKMFPDDMVTDQSMKLAIAEIIREKVFLYTYQEIPYSAAVEIDGILPRSEKLLYIRAIIHVEKESQRKILIGEGGRMIKKIGTLARQEIELFAGKKVYLDLHVKITQKWTDDKAAVRRFHVD